MGRPVGSRNKHHILDGKEKMIRFLYTQKIPQTQIAKEMGVSVRTIHNYLFHKE